MFIFIFLGLLAHSSVLIFDQVYVPKEFSINKKKNQETDPCVCTVVYSLFHYYAKKIVLIVVATENVEGKNVGEKINFQKLFCEEKSTDLDFDILNDNFNLMNFGDEKNGNGNKNNENYGDNNNNNSNGNGNNGYQINQNNNQNRNKNNENNSNNNNNNDENMIKDIYLSGGVLLCILEILPFNTENSFIFAMKCVLNETNNNIIIDTNMIMNNIKDNKLNDINKNEIENENNKENRVNNESKNESNNENNEQNQLNIILKNNKKRANYVKSISQGYIGLSKITSRINQNVLEESFSLILEGATAEPAGR